MCCSSTVSNRKDAEDFLKHGGIEILFSLMKRVNYVILSLNVI